MDFNLIKAVTGSSAPTNISWRDLLLIAIPIIATLVINLVRDIVNDVRIALRRAREQRQLVLGVKDELVRIDRRNLQIRSILHDDLENGEYERKMREDPRYFIYIAEGDASHEVFDTKARDFSFLKVECFNNLIEYYDTQSLIHRSLTGLGSELFRELSVPRKLSTMRNLVAMLDENSETYKRCQENLDQEPRAKARLWTRLRRKG